MFGQTKKTGEANMYPKPLQDLYGWNIRSIACGVSATVVVADNSVISFGPSPAFGELVSILLFNIQYCNFIYCLWY